MSSSATRERAHPPALHQLTPPQAARSTGCRSPCAQVPFFQGLTLADGEMMAAPVSAAFIAQVAVHMSSDVYGPVEKPPIGRLYVIDKGSMRYKGLVRHKGYSWGALDVMPVHAGGHVRMALVGYWRDGSL